jgi:peptidoglycan biosynthesis protein MviN/MurJ (putative lipid II flippase)
MACGIIVLNATCNSILIFGCQFGATSVALSTSFSALVHTGTLQFIYRKRYGLSYMHRTTILTLLIISASIGILSLMVAEWAGNPAPFSLLRESTPLLVSP